MLQHNERISMSVINTCTILVWDSGSDDGIELYAIPNNNPMAQVAVEANGIYINVNNEEGDACEQINEWLTTDEAKSMKIEAPAKGKCTCVTVCGFMP